jgi:hypothetical protein
MTFAARLGGSRTGTPITFQRGLNPNQILNAQQKRREPVSAPFTGKNNKKCRRGEHYGVVASLLHLETIDALAPPRSNQTTATLFDEGRNDTNGELR